MVHTTNDEDKGDDVDDVDDNNDEDDEDEDVEDEDVEEWGGRTSRIVNIWLFIYLLIKYIMGWKYAILYFKKNQKYQ